MARKRWTPQTEVTDSLLRIREKRRWQLSYRRYVLDRSPSEAYAPYFGLDIETLRHWFEIQFTEETNWANYGKDWQFDHIVPATYFDYSKEDDLKLCWSFINIRVEKTDLTNNRGKRIDVLAVRPYFQHLYNKTGYSLCLKMLDKISTIEISNLDSRPAIEHFIIENKGLLESIHELSHEEFNRLNQGTTVADVLLEREILRKFGARQTD
jgi:hypothetical protein